MPARTGRTVDDRLRTLALSFAATFIVIASATAFSVRSMDIAVVETRKAYGLLKLNSTAGVIRRGGRNLTTWIGDALGNIARLSDDLKSQDRSVEETFEVAASEHRLAVVGKCRRGGGGVDHHIALTVIESGQMESCTRRREQDVGAEC